MTSNGKSIAVLGAGAAGLAAAKYLIAEGFSVTVYERKASPGGVWNTSPGNGYWPSPVYEGLETNVPRTLMTLSDHAWRENVSLFPRSKAVQRYLQEYATDMRRSELGCANLRMELNTEVVDLRKATYLKAPHWKLESRKRWFGKEVEEGVAFFDGVVVAIGNYHQPFVPDDYDLKPWEEAHPGSLVHAVDFRKPEDFRDQIVLVVGNSASGWDISSQLAGVAKMVVVSSGRYKPDAQESLSAATSIGVPSIRSLDASMRSVTFTDGRTAYDVDRIVFCTGYVYDFSFIKKGTVDGDEKLFKTGVKVADVYEHIFYTEDPSLAFVGLPNKSAAFTVAEAQSAVVARAFAGRIKIWATPGLKRWQTEADAQWEQLMETGQAGAMDYHSFRLSTDKDYVNRLLRWSLRTLTLTIFGTEGQPPPYWCSCFDRARKESKPVREAFKAHNERRHDFTTHQSVGFTLQGPCDDGQAMTAQQQGQCRSCFIG